MRKNRGKGYAKQRNKIAALTKQSHAKVKLIQHHQSDEVQVGFSSGLFGTVQPIHLRIKHEDIVGAVENPEETGNIVVKVGLLVLSRLIDFNLADGPLELAKSFAKWAGIDLEAIKKEADFEAKLEESLKAVREPVQLELPLDGDNRTSQPA